MQQREMKIAGRANQKERSVPVVVSTSEPYDRGDFIEVLDHNPSSVDLSRAPLPLIESHDAGKLNIGLVDQLRVENGKLRGVAHFGLSARADEIFKDVVAGIVRFVSVGYEITKVISVDERTRVCAFKPYEVSAVSVPADIKAGFFRSKDNRMTTEKRETPEETRMREIVSLGELYGQYLKPSDTAEAVRNGTKVDAFREYIMQRMETGHTDTRSLNLDLNSREIQRYSLGRALQAAVTGDWREAGFEKECSMALEKKTGQRAVGFYVPHDYWRRDFNVGTSTEAGNLVATDLRGDLFLDALRNAMVLGRLGVTVLNGLSGNVDIPRKSAASSLLMLGEIGSATETNPSTENMTLSPKRVGAYVDVSKQALIQSAIAIEGMLRDDLLMGAAHLIENQCINGNGTAPNILGIRNYTTIGSSTAGTHGASLAWDHFVELESVCTNANAEPTMKAGYLSNSKVRAKAKKTYRGTNLDYILPPDAKVSADGLVWINGYRTAFSNVVPSNLTKGTSTTICSAAIFSSDWGLGIIGLFGPPDVVVDPYSLSVTGQVRITLNQFVDFGIRQPAAFVKQEDLLTI